MTALFLPAWSAMAQTPDPPPFYIGTYYFSPPWDATAGTVRRVRGVQTAPSLLHLSDVQFAAARALHMNLIFPDIHEDFVDIPTRNAVSQIHEEAADPASDALSICVLDHAIARHLTGERIMLHPESQFDFDVRGEYERLSIDEFEHTPIHAANLSRALRTNAPVDNDNCVLFEPGKGVISNLKEEAKRQFSMFRNTWNQKDRDEKAASGLYIVSAVVKIVTPGNLQGPNSTRSLMDVVIHTNDSTGYHAPASLTFSLQERHFFDGETVITDPLEVVLGFIEIRHTFDSVVYFLERPELPSAMDNPAWANTSLASFAKMVLNEEFWSNWDEALQRTASFDIELRYGDENCDATFHLDALCLSSPRTFAMFHPGHEIFQSGPLSVWQSERQEFLDRVEMLLTDRSGNPPDPLPLVRFIAGPEAGLRAAVWPLASVGQRLLDDASGGAAMLYCALGHGENARTSADMNARYALGYYGYPMHITLPRPDSDRGASSSNYHIAVNSHDKKGFTVTARRYLEFAIERKKLDSVNLWIPFIQNHSNLFATEIPGWWDRDELREPSAAELRYQCNMALAFGANGIMFYTLVSAPWTASADPFWPSRRDVWESDSMRTFDEDCGVLGFLDTGAGLTLAERESDWHGENKFEATATFIRDELRPLSEFIVAEGLVWERSKLWHLKDHPGVNAGDAEWVTGVMSLRPAEAGGGRDAGHQTYVITSEFTRSSDGERFVLVVNGRTHREDSDRYIRLVLGTMGGTTDNWWAQNVLTGDEYYMRAMDARDSLNPRFYSFGEELYKPGQAALFRVWNEPKPPKIKPWPPKNGNVTVSKYAVP
jgi:hypothetical protein